MTISTCCSTNTNMGIPFSAFWLRSSVVSVLISLITYVLEFPVIMINCIFQGSDPTAVLAQWEARMAVALHAPPRTSTPLHNTVTKPNV